MDEAETKELMECSENMVVSVGMAKLGSTVELLDEKVQDMARLVEVTMEVLVETDDRTNCPASWMEFDSSFFPSYKVQTGLVPTEVETGGATYSVNARSLLAWARTIVEKTASHDALAELVHEAQNGCVPALVIWIGPSQPWWGTIRVTLGH